MRLGLCLGTSILAALSLAGQAFAQAGPSASPAPAVNPGEASAGAAVSPGAAGAILVAPAPAGGTTYAPARDPNNDLPSSSRPRVGSETDGFDLARPGGASGVVYGGKGASAVLGAARPQEVPAVHVVRKGDTLWDLSDSYYQNPWGWPKVWSYNPQIVNPHWIYPGDQIRLRDASAAGGAQRAFAAAPGAALATTSLGKGKSGSVPPTTIFLRDQGFLGDPKRDVWGELVGSAEDQMLLADGNRVYLMMRPGVTLTPGQMLTLFTPLRKPDDVKGARRPPGEIVSVKGTIKVDQFDPKTRVASGEVVESLDVIERGFKVGPVGRRFDVVPPTKAEKSVQTRVLTSLYPHELLGQHQLAFLDRGAEDGLSPGARLFVLRRGDNWRGSLTVASGMLKDRVKMESSERVDVERTPTSGDDKQFPTEVVAELRVLRTEKYSAVAIVIESRREIEPGDVATTLVGR